MNKDSAAHLYEHIMAALRERRPDHPLLRVGNDALPYAEWDATNTESFDENDDESGSCIVTMHALDSQGSDDEQHGELALSNANLLPPPLLPSYSTPALITLDIDGSHHALPPSQPSTAALRPPPIVLSQQPMSSALAQSLSGIPRSRSSATLQTPQGTVKAIGDRERVTGCVGAYGSASPTPSPTHSSPTSDAYHHPMATPRDRERETHEQQESDTPEKGKDREDKKKPGGERSGLRALLSPLQSPTINLPLLSPSRSASGSGLSAEARRFCAAPSSLKTIYADTMRSTHLRFTFAPPLTNAVRRPARAIGIACWTAFICFVLAFLLMHWIQMRVATMSKGGQADMSTSWLNGIFLQPRTLAFICSTATCIVVLLLATHVYLLLRLSSRAHDAIWLHHPHPDASAEEEAESIAAAAASGYDFTPDPTPGFQRADKAWWLSQFVNRWYAVRYQAWAPPLQGRLMFLLLVGSGSFVAAWTGDTLVLGALPGFAVSLALCFPAFCTFFLFRLGRILGLSRFMHLCQLILHSLLQLIFVIQLLHMHNPLLGWLFHRTGVGWGIACVALSFAPNLAWAFCLLWMNEKYIRGWDSSWIPVILPPYTRTPDDDAIMPQWSQARSTSDRMTDPSQPLPPQPSPSATYLASQLFASNTAQAFGVDPWTYMPPTSAVNAAPAATSGASSFGPYSSTFPSSAASFVSAYSLAAPSSSWTRSIPPASTCGRLAFGADLERTWIERRCSPRLRSIILSRWGTSIWCGILAYATSHAYWAYLFALPLTPAFTFLTQPWSVRIFHVAAMAQFMTCCVLLAAFAVLIALQNGDWRWWWTPVRVQTVAALFVSLRYAWWKTAMQEALLNRDTAASIVLGLSPSLSSSPLSSSLSSLSIHWLYWWSSWVVGWAAMCALAFCACWLMMMSLYRPRSVKAAIHADAMMRERAAALRMDEEMHGCRPTTTDTMMRTSGTDAHSERGDRGDTSPLLTPTPLLTSSSSSHRSRRAVPPLSLSVPLPAAPPPSATPSMTLLQAMRDPSSTPDVSLWADVNAMRNELEKEQERNRREAIIEEA